MLEATSQPPFRSFGHRSANAARIIVSRWPGFATVSEEVQNMPEKALSDEQSSPSNCEDLGALKIVNRELVHLVKARNLRIMDLERKVKHLEACMRE